MNKEQHSHSNFDLVGELVTLIDFYSSLHSIRCITMPSIITTHSGITCSSVQITTLHALLCNKQMQKAYVFFSSSCADSTPFLCFLNFTNPSTIPSTRTIQTPPATSPPRKDPTVTTLLPSTVHIPLDCSSAMGDTYNTWLCIHSIGVTLMLRQLMVQYQCLVHHIRGDM